MKQPKITIIGAGISGLTAAIALSQKGFSQIQLFEEAAQFGAVGAGIQLGPNAVRALAKLGLFDELSLVSDSSAYGELRDGASGHLLAKMPLSDHSQRAYGVPSYQMMRSDLHSILLAKVMDLGVAIYSDSELLRVNRFGDGERDDESQNETGAELEFVGGQKVCADMVIAADGLNSVVTNQLFPEMPIYYSGYSCWRGVVDRRSLAHNWVDSVSVWTGSNKHLVAYPTAKSTKLNLVGVIDRPEWPFRSRIQTSSVDEWHSAFSDWSPDVLAMMEQVQQTQLWGLFERQALPRWHRGRCVLIGDAAHPMMPSLAQGAAQGIEDALILAELLSGHSSELENLAQIEAVFGQFYAVRHKRVERVQRSARWNVNFFHKSQGAYRAFRNSAVRSLGPVTTALMARRYHWLYKG